MFQIPYSDPEVESAASSEPNSRLSIDLDALREQVFRKGNSDEILQMSFQDMVLLIQECVFWQEQAMEAQEELERTQLLAEEALTRVDELAKINGQLARERGEF